MAGIILDETSPWPQSVSFDNEEPAVTRVGGEVIEDDATALGAFDEPHCWVHWVMLIGVLLTVGLRCGSGEPPRLRPRRIDDFNNSLTSTVTTGAEDTRAARVAHKAYKGAAAAEADESHGSDARPAANISHGLPARIRTCGQSCFQIEQVRRRVRRAIEPARTPTCRSDAGDEPPNRAVGGSCGARCSR